MEKPEFFSRDIYLAWLLRKDVRTRLQESSGSEAQKEFVVWWYMFGCKEYPVGHPPSQAQIEVAGEVVHAAHGLQITRLMRSVYRARKDVQTAHNVATEEGYAGFFRWFYLYGVAEFGLYSLLARRELEFLRSPLEGVQQENELALTRLMYMVWQVRDDLRNAFALDTPESRERYAAWFYTFGIKEFKLQPYLHPADVAVLHAAEPRFATLSEAPVSRLMWLCRLVDPALWEKTDLQTAAGRRALKTHVDGKLHSDPALQGIQNSLHSRSRPLRYMGPGVAESPLGTGAAWSEAKKSQARSGPFGVNLVGYGLGELGIGEDVRMMARALEGVGVDFCVLNRQPSPEIRQMDLSIAHHFSPEPRYPVTIICMTAFDTAALWLDCPDLFKTTYVIGFWPWELPDWPKEWDGVYELVDEIWSSSQFTFDAFARRAPVPIMHMPMTVTIEAMSAHGRVELGLPEDSVLYLFVFDFMSYPARKNPHACIQAFRQAFPGGDEKVNLVLKISNVVKTSAQWTELMSACAADPRILVIDHTIDRGVVLALMHNCDAYVSLHRSEGFGRTMAEAMLLEKPVIATKYSGNADFLDEDTGYPVDYRMIAIGDDEYPFGMGMEWADPDISRAAAQMREVHERREEALLRAGRGREKIALDYSATTVGIKVRTRLQQLAGTSAEADSQVQRPESPRHD